MAHGEQDETRLLARLPGLDIAVIHRGAGDHGGEEVMLALRTRPPAESFVRLVEATHPLLVWSWMAQAVWAAWLGGFAAAPQPPRIPRGG